MQRKKVILSAVAATSIIAAVVPLTITLTACSNKKSNVIMDTYHDYQSQKQKLVTNKYGLVNKQKETEIVNNLKDYLNKFSNMLSQTKQKSANPFSINEMVWLNSIIYELKTELKSYELNMRYLGGVQSDNRLVYPLNAFNNYVINNAKDALEITNLTDDQVQQSTKKLSDFIEYLQILEANLKEGVTHQVAQSIIITRLFITNLMQVFYEKELEFWAQPNSDPKDTTSGLQEITCNELLNGPENKDKKSSFVNTNFMLQDVNKIQSSGLKKEIIDEYINKANTAQKQLNTFFTYMFNDYFAGMIAKDSKYGFGGTTRPLLYKVEKTDTKPNAATDHKLKVTTNETTTPIFDKEVERTYSDLKGENHLYGMGLTTNDLTTKDIGLGFMKNKELGAQMYDHLLKLSTTTNMDANQVYDIGMKNTQNGVDNMKSLANAVVALQTNNKYTTENGIQLKTQDNKNITEWKPTIAYDADGSGPQEPKVEQLTFTYVDPAQKQSSTSTWDANWTTFNKWLNNEDFFWGRERQISTLGTSQPSAQPNVDVAQSKLGDLMFSDADYKVLLSEKTPTTSDLQKYDLTVDEWKYYVQLLKETGYWTQWNVTNKKLGNIPTQTALCGAITELRDYYKFANNYAKAMNQTYTKPVTMFKIRPYDYSKKDIAGVGEEGDSTKEWIYINVDPYLDLQKWSETSFTSHETFLGHRTQMEYALEHPAEVDGYKGPQYDLTAFHEGWAVFIEWFNNQINNFGIHDEKGGIPTDFSGTNATGFVPGDINSGDKTGKTIKDFQNGIYWNSINQNNNFTLKDEKDGWNIATELGNMLQYYGFLNESQLRNMRQAVDVAIHAEISPTETNKYQKNGEAQLTGGASIQDVRDFMHANSALGVGDVSTESIRYVANPGQATSYMTGKDAIQQIYEAVDNQFFATNHKHLAQDPNEIKKLFDVILRNGSIPLSVLKDEVYSEYNLH